MWSTSIQQRDGERLTRGRGRRYAWAVGAGVVARSATPLLSLLITPYALSKLGAERFGLFALALTLAGWLAVLNPGLAPGLRVVLARRSQKLDIRELAPLLAAAARGQRALAILVLVAGSALAVAGPAALGLPAHLRQEAGVLLSCIAAGAAALVWGRHYAAALEACQQVGAERAARLGQSVLRMTLLVGLLALGWGLQAAGWSFVIAAVVAAIALRALCLRLLPELAWRASSPTPTAFAELLRPGAWMSAGAVAGVMIMGVDRAVVARLISLEAVTVFALSGAAFLLAEGLLAPVVDAARPALAQALGRGRTDEARLIYIQLANGAAGLAPAAALGLFAANRAFVTAWTGADAYGGWELDLWFGSALIVNTWSLPHRALLSAALRAREATLWRLAEGGLNLALSLVLALRYGIEGVAAGTVVAALLTSGWALPRLAAASVQAPVRNALVPAGRALLLLVGLAPFAAWARGAASGYLGAAAAAAIVSGAALVLWWKTSLSRRARRAWVMQLREGRRKWSAA